MSIMVGTHRVWLLGGVLKKSRDRGEGVGGRSASELVQGNASGPKKVSSSRRKKARRGGSKRDAEGRMI